MLVKVFNNDELVFNGALAKFLADNDNDDWLTEICKPLISGDEKQVEFYELSGDWLIVPS